jgi:hypothetical protein
MTDTSSAQKVGELFRTMVAPEYDAEIVIQDSFLRKKVITACMKIEEAIKAGKFKVGQKTTSSTPWGLAVEIQTSQPKEDKPIIFKFLYKVNRIQLDAWAQEHKYLLEGPCLAFVSRGIGVTVPGLDMSGNMRTGKTIFDVVVSQNDDGPDDKVVLNLLNKTAAFVVHREVISQHDWIVRLASY